MKLTICEMCWIDDETKKRFYAININDGGIILIERGERETGILTNKDSFQNEALEKMVKKIINRWSYQYAEIKYDMSNDYPCGIEEVILKKISIQSVLDIIRYEARKTNKRGREQKIFSMAVKQRDKNKCQNCGAEKNLHAHHKDNNYKNNDISNGITLCKRCHIEVHKKISIRG